MSVEERRMPRQSGKREKENITTAPKMLTPAPSTPSKPVVIPTRSRDGGRRKSRESVVKDRRRDEQKPHNPSSTSPSMAALVAMTSPPESVRQPQPEIRRNSSSLTSRRMQIAKLQEPPRRTISSSSPQSWDALLSPPEDSEMENGSLESDTTLGPLSSLRSLSTESMPSLDTDTESLSSASNPGTPGFLSGNRLGNERKQRSVSTSLGEDCVLDHPLLPPVSRITYEENSMGEAYGPLSPTSSPLARSTSYFKSNLTASFRKIRSAAQSFSAFTTPPTQREDYLARSLLSMDSQFTDERRPQPSMDPPDPALRRYLNPTKFSPAELHFHSHSEESSQPARPNCTASIQLQTYQRRNRSLDKASSPPIFASAQQKALDAVDGLPQTSSSPRQREPRENSDFLRVIVLEMNMRKNGKLNDASPGRAKLWLPARQAGKGTTEESTAAAASVEGGGKIPERWMGMPA